MNTALVFVNRLPDRGAYHKDALGSMLDTGVDFYLTDGGVCPGRARYDTLHRCLQWGYLYVGWFDDDDILAPGVYSRLVTVLNENPDASVAHTREVQFTSGPLKTYRKTQDVRHHTSVHRAHHPLLFRADVLVEYYARLLHHGATKAEKGMMHDMVQDGHCFAELNEIGYYWRQWDGQDHKSPIHPYNQGKYHARSTDSN